MFIKPNPVLVGIKLMAPHHRYTREGSIEKSYQKICEKYPSFHDRSENVDPVVEISLQPWKVFNPDGVILFSNILTPLSGMNIPFDIVKGKGPIIFNPPTSATDVDQVREFVPEESVPYVSEALTILRKEVVPLLMKAIGWPGGSILALETLKRLVVAVNWAGMPLLHKD